MTRRILRLQEIHERTGIPVETLRHYRKVGKGPQTYILAGHIVCDEPVLEAWLDEQRAITRMDLSPVGGDLGGAA